MEVSFTYGNDNLEVVFKSIMDIFLRKYPDSQIEWKKERFSISANINISDKDITEIFEMLVNQYEGLSVYASYYYDVREDDYSADWWGVHKIYSERKDGKTAIRSSSSTYWN